jgi:hypothetical protein
MRLTDILLAIAIVGFPIYTRLVRGIVLSVPGREDPGDGGAVLPRPGHPAAHGRLGQHAGNGPRGRQPEPARGAPARARHLRHRAGLLRATLVNSTLELRKRPTRWCVVLGGIEKDEGQAWPEEARAPGSRTGPGAARAR